MDKLKLSFCFTALWVLVVYAVPPLLGGLPLLLPMIIFDTLIYSALVLAIIMGIISSRQTIKAKEKMASIAIILTAINTLFLFSYIYVGWGV